MPRLTPDALPNLGPKSAEALALAGVRTVDDLRKLGSVRAYAKAKKAGAKVSLNLLWALEGALTDLPWRVVAREHRTSLLLALESLDRDAGPPALAAAAPTRPCRHCTAHP